MGLVPVGESEVDLLVDGEQVDQFRITDSGEIRVETDAQVESGATLNNLLSGSKSGAYDPWDGATRQHSLFDFAAPVDVALDWNIGVYEGDDPYLSGHYVKIVADGNVVDRVDNEYDEWVTSSDRRTVTCSSAYVEWETNDNEAGAGPAVTFDVDWDATPEVSKSVNVDVGSSTYEK